VTEIVPNLSSAFVLGKNLDIETRVNFAERATTFDTRLHVRSLGPFFDELEGRVWRSPDGLTNQLLRLGFYQIVGNATAVSPLTLTGRAILEVSNSAGFADPGRRRFGVETRFAGFVSPFVPGKGALSFKVERVVGPRPESARTLGFDQSWTMRNLTKLGLNLKLLHATQSTERDIEPSIDFTWRSEF
jgi:hypothetical protein